MEVKADELTTRFRIEFGTPLDTMAKLVSAGLLTRIPPGEAHLEAEIRIDGEQLFLKCLTVTKTRQSRWRRALRILRSGS